VCLAVTHVENVCVNKKVDADNGMTQLIVLK
jgi:hypothetical protein